MIKKVAIFEKDPNKLDHALKSKTIKEILERFDVPMFGFKTLDQFFASASVIGRLNNINVPVTMLHAEDDPIAPIDCMYALFHYIDGSLFYQIDAFIFTDSVLKEIYQNENIVFISTKYGGHVGYIERGLIPKFWLQRFFSQYVPFVCKNHLNIV